jgi:DNA polymerase III subunit delta
VIVKAGEAGRFALKPPAALVAALVYGPDQGLVRERADSLAKSAVADLSDPFRVAELEGDALIADPAKLWDEAATISMLGGRRVVRVRGCGNGLAKLFERFLDERLGDALVVVEAGELAKSSALRRLFEEADNAAALPCYLDSGRDLETVVQGALKEAGLAIEPGALAEAVARLGSDRGVTRRELEKLALYAQGAKTVTLADVQAVMGDESELRMEQLCDAAGEGDYVRLDRLLTRLWAAGASPVAVIRMALGHFQRVLLARAKADEGAPLGETMKSFRPPIHFQRADSFRAQVSRLSSTRLEEALALLYEAEILCKTTAVPNEAVTGRALFNIAALASR